MATILEIEHGLSSPPPPQRWLSDSTVQSEPTTVPGRVGSPLDIEKGPQDGGLSDHPNDTNPSTTTPIPHSDPTYKNKIWGLYLSQAEKIDKEHSESWTANTDGVLVFTGLFSAVVGAFLLVSYPLLQPSPTDTTNRLLTQISQQLSTSGTGSQLLPPVNTSSFRPPASAVRVNVLWFTSLAMSTACALWATLMQQWTRRYMQLAGRPYSPPKRARIRAFFADGVEHFGLAAAVEVLPGILHTSVLLFYVGLIDFLFNINHTVAFFLLTWVAMACLIYFILSIMPLFYPNSPYQTPLSSLCWIALEVMPLLGFWVRRRKDDFEKRWTKIGRGMRRALESNATRLESLDSDATRRNSNATRRNSKATRTDSNANLKAKTPEEKATLLQAHADTNALRWTLGSLDEDHELEEFLDGLPGLFHHQFHGTSRRTSRDFSQELKARLVEFVEPVAVRLFATCTTGILPEGLRRQRLTACLRAIWCFSGTIDIHFQAIWDQWGKLTNNPWAPLSVETWAVASSMTRDSDPFVALRAHCVQALMAAMWSKGEWQCALSEATSLLQSQLQAFSADIDGWQHTNGNQLQLAVAANLLTNSLELLDKPESGGEKMKTKLQKILDTMCAELNTSILPQELQDRFANRAKVMEVFKIGDAAGGLNGPWMKVVKPVGID